MEGHDGTVRTEADESAAPAVTSAVLDGDQLLVDFPAGRGIRQVAIGPAQLVQRSEEALNAAMGAIRGMARRVDDAVSGLARRPDGVEVEFGITLDAESGAMIAKAGVGASLTVRLTWDAERP